MSSSRCGLSVDLNYSVTRRSIAVIVHYMVRKLHHLVLGLISYLLLVRVYWRIHGVTWNACILIVNSYEGFCCNAVLVSTLGSIGCDTHSCCLALLALLSVLMSKYHMHEILFTCEAVLKGIHV